MSASGFTGDERKTRATNEFIATGDLTGDVSWYVEGRTVNVPKFDSTGTIQADGNIAWGRDGNKAIYEGNAGVLSTGNQSIRNDGGKIALKSVHGKFSAPSPMAVLSGIVLSQATGNFSNWMSGMGENYAQKYARQVCFSPTRW